MNVSNYLFAALFILFIFLQLLAGFWHISDPFIDGRYHYNWGPPFWLMKAEETNEIGLLNTYFGVANYPSHPQLIGPVIATWTNVVGYSEFSVRLLALTLTIIGTALLTLAVWSFVGNRQALAFGLIFATLPIVYIYGKKLDQEPLVLIFLAVQLWGSGLIGSRPKIALTMVFFGALGMMLSDWSGAVFSVALSIAAIIVWGWSEYRNRAIAYVAASGIGTALGLAIFLMQSFLQSSLDSFWKLIESYYGLWRYRTGASTTSFSWVAWLSSHFSYLSKNFNIPIVFAGIGWLLWQLRTKTSAIDSNSRALVVFSVAILVGSVVYMLAVPQVSGIHIYFQYYLSVPITIGLLFLIEFFAQKFSGAKQLKVWLALLGIVVICNIGWSVYQYNTLLNFNTWGDATDIALLKTIRELPIQATVVAAEEHPILTLWFQNPNIKYYTGREIQTYVLEDGVPIADYQIIPSRFKNDLTAFINNGSGYGKGVSASIVSCSTNYCLLELVK